MKDESPKPKKFQIFRELAGYLSEDATKPGKLYVELPPGVKGVYVRVANMQRKKLSDWVIETLNREAAEYLYSEKPPEDRKP